jgi:hypothetical protein
MKKGQISYSFTITEAVVSFLLVIGIVSGVAIRSGDFIARETVDLQAERIDNAALALTSIPEGHVEINLEAKNNYSFKYESGNVSLNYSGVVKEHPISSDLAGYDSIRAPSEFAEISSELCLKKIRDSNQEILEFNVEGCSDD